MTTIGNAISALGITEWSLKGDPKTEEEFKQSFRKVTGTTSNGSSIESADPKDWGTTWKAVSDKKTELVNAEPMRLLRVERNRLLAETDWTQLPNAPLTDAKKKEWETYRQALRDLPSKSTPKLIKDVMFDYDSVTFPTKPL
tara:strand:- start:44 stop:469 length:426 start_codon:yes stop_codon:yes gene_type:complete